MIEDGERRMRRENETIYFQPIPGAAPPLPPPKRLVAPVAFALPPPAPSLRDGTLAGFDAAAIALPAAAAGTQGGAAGGDADEHAQQGCLFCRWLLVIIAAPLLLLVSLVGIVVRQWEGGGG